MWKRRRNEQRDEEHVGQDIHDDDHRRTREHFDDNGHPREL
jgi:hypothetical protein